MVEIKMPKISAIANPLKIGSSTMKKAPMIAARAVSVIGRAHCDRLDYGFFELHTIGYLLIDKIHQLDRVAYDNPRLRRKAWPAGVPR